MQRHVVIIGAGITGLAAAYYLEKQAREAGRSIRCTIVEAGDQAGGKIVTERVNDFIIEGGPDSFVTDKPWALALCHDLGIADQLIPCNQKDTKVYVLNRSRLIPLPTGFRLTIPTQFWPFIKSPLISPWGKLRMAMDYFLPPRPAEGDESVGHFIGRRMGREAVEKFAGPLMAGIYVSDPDKLSMRGTFPRFLDMERKHGSLIKAALAARKSPPPPRNGPAPAGNAMFNALRGGMFALIESLREQIESDLLLQTTVHSLRREGNGFVLHMQGKHAGVLNADDVILTAPARVAAELVRDVHGELATQLAAIRYVSTATVSLAYLKDDLPTDRPLDGFGVIIPPGEKRRIIACTWASTKFKYRAPRDCALIRVFVGGYRDESLAELDEPELIEMVRDELADILGITARPAMVNAYRWPKGNPQYDVGHPDRVAAMEALAATVPGLHLAGGAYHGVGMPDCIRSARMAVDRIIPPVSARP